MKLQRQITRHYCMHPIFYNDKMFGELRQTAVQEIQNLLLPSQKELNNYLMKNWYNENDFMTWGYRSLENGIPTTRTTMVVEAHWRVLKTRFLALHNRPRLEYVVHILNTQVIPKYIRDYDLYSQGIKRGEWWSRFTKDWKSLSSQSVQNHYDTSLSRWWCTCPAFRVHAFHLCKHLCHLQSCPPYRNIVRSRTPPFYKFLHEDGRRYPILESTCMNEIERTTPNYQSICSESNTRLSIIHRQAHNTFSELLENFEWMKNHLHDLNSTPAGEMQMNYIRTALLPRIKSYRESIEKDKRSRAQTPTWSRTPDTLWNP